ncbi:MAG: HAD-IIA family hydrolase [Desulfuromonadales bacterium]|nr:HAD-IIA family hydrolase [Desulfuromonadales bacterium]
MSERNYYRGYIFDLDGTIYLGEKVIPGAPKIIASLRQQGCRVIFLSNKPLQPRKIYAQKLTQLGIPTATDEVINSSLVLIRYLLREMPAATVFAIGETPLLDELAAAGISLSDTPEKIDVVVASFDRTFDYRKLNIGFQALRLGARFLATNADRACPIDRGEIPDAAAVIGALEGCSGRKVELVAGKPSSLIVETALERLGLQADDCLMIGDRLETDILMGKNAGMATALVFTGVTQQEDLPHSSIQPDYILESVADILNI